MDCRGNKLHAILKKLNVRVLSGLLVFTIIFHYLCINNKTMKYHPLKGYEDNFEISKEGEVRNIKTGNTLKIFKKGGYYKVRLCFNNKVKKPNISRLLAINFIPNPENYKSVCFKDGDIKNYQLLNLYWTNRTPGKEAVKVPKNTSYGDLTVLEDKGVIKGLHTILCECSCGEKVEYPYTLLNTGNRIDCGHVRKEKIPNLDIKQVNNRILKNKKTKRYIIEVITAERDIKGKIKRRVKLKCRYCSTETEMRYKDFCREGKERCYTCSKIEKTNGRGGVTHNLSKHPLYRTYTNMKSRCYNKNNKYYKHYGNRGIKICEEWLSNFKNFYKWAVSNGWEHKLTIERLNNDGDYSPFNCAWVDRAVQCRNQTTTKLDWDKVEEIRHSTLTSKLLSVKYDVSTSTINSVRRYKTWVK